VIQFIFFLTLGAGFLLALFFFWRRGRSTAEGGAEALLDARNALNTLQFSLLPPELIARIFARADLEYIESSTSQEIQKYFHKERRQIALIWINQVRSHLVSLRRFYVGRSRFYAQMSGGTEMSLAWNFAMLLSACRMVQLLLYVRGPLAAPRMVGATIAKAGRVCEVSAKSLAYLKSMNPEGAGRDEAGNEAAL
jgi:hypothetical protein